MNIDVGQKHLLLLRCDGVPPASEPAVAVVEGMLKSVLHDYDEIMEDGVAGSWMDESYATKAYDVLEKKGYSGTLDDAVEATSVEAEELLSGLMTRNHTVLQGMSNGYLVDEVAVLRRFPNLWVVQVYGSKFPF